MTEQEIFDLWNKTVVDLKARERYHDEMSAPAAQALKDVIRVFAQRILTHKESAI